jgi:hypothetical protein
LGKDKVGVKNMDKEIRQLLKVAKSLTAETTIHKGTYEVMFLVNRAYAYEYASLAKLAKNIERELDKGGFGYISDGNTEAQLSYDVNVSWVGKAKVKESNNPDFVQVHGKILVNVDVELHSAGRGIREEISEAIKVDGGKYVVVR